MLITVSTVTKQGIGSLQQAKTQQFSKQAFFAAEAGACDALREIVENPSFAGPISTTPLPLGATYSVLITNNIAGGSGPMTASNGADVPEGFAYILATGVKGSISRRVGLLVSPGSATAFGVAIGAGGSVDMQGSKTIYGTIKASGDIDMQGSTRIIPLSGSGRVLSGADVRFQGSTRIDDSQDVRARGNIVTGGSTRGGLVFQSSDTTDDSLPFIADYRLTNALLPGESGVVLPNPDQSVLLDPTINTNLVIHTETSLTDLTLNNQVHYFPDGISFSGSANIVGPGTIVVGNGNQMEFQGSTGTIDANLIALRDPTQFPSGGNPSITFQGSSRVNGLIYAHEDVSFQGSSRVNGVVIAYRDGGGNIDTQGSTRITLDAEVFADIPGFESWAAGFGGVGGHTGTGPISVDLWERM